MSQSRRDFIKFVVVGSVTAGCPIDATLLAVPPDAATTPVIDSEHFEVCHQVRDGHTFKRPAPTQKAAVVIIGGGVAGLSAAYFLRGQDFLLLEKEDHSGEMPTRKSSKASPSPRARHLRTKVTMAISSPARSGSSFSPSTIPIPPSSTRHLSPKHGNPVSISCHIRKKSAKASAGSATTC